MSDPDKSRGRPGAGTIAIWVAVAAVALYFIVSGVIGLVNGGG